MPPLPALATSGHVVPDFNKFLWSVGQICDANHVAVFTTNLVQIYNARTYANGNDVPILQGQRNYDSGLWEIPNTKVKRKSLSLVNPFAAYVHKLTSTEKLITFYHQTAGNPVKSTWLKAIANKQYRSWPGLTTDAVNKYLKPSTATAKGHLTLIRKNLRSTKANYDTMPEGEPPLLAKTNAVFAASAKMEGLICTDLAGWFPITSLDGHKYIFVLYAYDPNFIFIEPIKNRSKAEHIQVYDKLHAQLTQRRFQPRLHRLDNEASTALKNKIVNNECKFQLFPMYNHGTNYAERAIQTAKSHIIASFCTANPKFPMYCWNHFTQQMQLTLNLLRTSRLHRQLSAQAHVFGKFDFNATPLLPVGTKTLIFKNADICPSWDTHADNGWYMGPALEHYQCYRCLCDDTKKPVVTNTAEFFPHYVQMPTLNSTEMVIAAAKGLTFALQNPGPAAPYQVGHNMIQPLRALSNIFEAALCSPNKPVSATKNNFATLPAATPDKITSLPQHRLPSPPPRDVMARQHQKQNAPHFVHQNDDNAFRRVRSPNGSNQHTAPRVPSIGKQPPTHRYPTRTRQQPCAQALVVFDAESGKLLEYCQLHQHPKYKPKFGRLAQGICDIPGTDTIFFVPKSKVPRNKKVIYVRLVCELCPQKEEKERTRMTVGGDRLDYDGPTSTETADITTVKLIVNSTISTPGARFGCFDIKIFISSHPFLNPSTSECTSCSFRMKSLTSITFENWQTPTDMSTCKSAKACTALNKPVASRMSSSKNSSPRMFTVQRKQHRAYGNTTPVRSRSSSSSTTLASNMLDASTQNIWCRSSSNTTLSPKIGRDDSTAASPSIGTIPKGTLTPPSPVSSRSRWTN